MFRHRKWYVTAVIFGLGAVGAEIYSGHLAGLAVRAVARQIAEGMVNPGHEAASYYSRWSTIWNLTGICMVALLATCWLISTHKREPAVRGPLLGLLTVYLLLNLILA